MDAADEDSRSERLPAALPAHHSRHPVQRQSAKLWHQAPLKNIGAERVARGLGWFSIGLGLAQLLAPQLVARMCGLSGRHSGLVRLYGVREIASGLLIFGQGRIPVAGIWSRVAGDALDLATLSAAAALPRTNRVAVAGVAIKVLGIAAIDVLCAQELSRQAGVMTDDGGLRVTRSIAINRPPEELYAYWRELENLPRFMYHLREVRRTGPTTSHWVTSGPAGKDIEWDSEITADRPNELLAWRSLDHAELENSGTVRFEPRPRGDGTIVRVELEYHPPGGIAGAALAMMFNESPQQQLYDDLHRLKQLFETGEIVRSDGSPAGTGSVDQQPARPSNRIDALPRQSAPAAVHVDQSIQHDQAR